MNVGKTTLRGIALLILALLLGACGNLAGPEEDPDDDTWSYTVTFDKNGGDAEAVPAAKTVVSPATGVDTLPEPPTRTGYVFAGWNTQADGSGAAFDGTSTVDGDLTVYAQWTAIPSGPHTLVFKLNDGTAANHATKVVAPPATVLAAEDFPADPVRTGYVFAGWNTQPGGGGTAFNSTSTVGADLTVYAQWTPKTYTVVFKSNDGSDTTLHTKTVTVPATTISGFPADPTRTGYEFAGWNTLADGSGTAFNSTSTVSADLAIYAQWTEIQLGSYIVVFKLNDGTETSHASKTVTPPASAIAAGDFPADPTRTGYDFVGWNTLADGSGTAFNSTSTVSADLTVYARWTGKTYTVKFMRNHDGGDAAILDSKTVTVPAKTVISFPASPTRAGHVFAGWNTQANGGGSAFDSTTVVGGDIAVYAQWNQTYTVIFKRNYDPDTTLHTKTVTAPATTISGFPADPTRVGYVFAGWNTRADGGGSAFNSTSTVSADLTLYAQWGSYSYTVVFNKNGGDGEADPSTKTVVSPATSLDALPVSPTRTGYGFAGWNTQADGGGTAFDSTTTVSGDITVYAQWAGVKQFAISLSGDIGEGAFAKESFAVSKSGGTGSMTVSLVGAVFARPRWFVDGDPKGTGNALVINAADYTLGNHILTLEATRSGQSWSKTISFAVAPGNLREVIFRNNDATGTIHALRTLSAGTSLGGSFPVNPDRAGYDFANWNTKADGSGAAFDSATTVSDETTVYAQWSPKTYTVTFDSNQGETGASPATKSVTRPYMHIDALPTPPTRTGWNFAGWNTEFDGSGTAFGLTTIVASDLTLYAQWAHEQFDITLSADAGNGLSIPTDFIVYKSGISPGGQTLSIAGGYARPRWFVDGDPKGTESSITIQAVDYTLGKHILTLIAIRDGISWSKEIPFTVEADTIRGVIFRSNDGTGLIHAIRTLTAGESLGGDFPADPGRVDYAFAGWNTQPGGGGTALDSSTPVNDETTVYAQWSPNTYTVTFDSNQGDTDASPATKPVTRPYIYIDALPAPPTRTGWNFAGWNTKSDGSGTAFGLTTVVASDLRVYAQWAHEHFNISLGADAGAEALTQGDFVLAKSKTLTISLDGSGYAKPRWFVDGDLKGTGSAITINGADYGVGKHSLALLATRGGVSWSKEILFTITN
jgi:uncharacterized repeat protein (TIGR02543 family)